MDVLGETALITMSRGNCPVCGRRGFVLGPGGGGMAQNIECADLKCRARFNVLCMSGEFLTGETIPRESEGGGVWPSGGQ